MYNNVCISVYQKVFILSTSKKNVAFFLSRTMILRIYRKILAQ